MLVAGLVAGAASCGGIADMTDAGEAATFTVETPSLGAQTFEVDDEQVQCWAVPNGTGGADLPPTLLDVVLQHGESAGVRLTASSYGEDGVAHASNRAGACVDIAALCCAREACLDVTLWADGVGGLGGDDDCWVDVAYSNGWAFGEFDCTFDARAREPGTRVHGSFRCAVEEWTAPPAGR